MVLSALRDVVSQPYGTGHEASVLGDIALAGKTGTSQRSDAWFAGLTPSIVCVVWVGFDNNSPLYKTGGSAALPIWISFMRQAARVRPDLMAGDFISPDGLIERPIDPDTGMFATTRCPKNRLEFFLEGRELTEYCSVHPGPALEMPVDPPLETEQQPDSQSYSETSLRQNGSKRNVAEPLISETTGENRQTRPRRVNEQTRISLQRTSPLESPE
jgi:membrane carboxypeptidase/penicillin-binding protein